MLKQTSTSLPLRFVILLTLFTFLMMGCGPDTDSTSSDTPSLQATIPVTVSSNGTNVSGEEGYPASVSNSTPPPSDSGYPGTRPLSPDASQEIPDPERDFQDPGGEYGFVGGVLIEDLQGDGYRPAYPQAIYLGEVVRTTDGQPALIGQSSDSPEALIYPTGVFVFENVPPGEYGLVVDLAFNVFPVTQNGEQIILTVEAGKAIDLGQIVLELP